MPAIVLATLNARYAHASLGLRCLRANLGELREDSEIVEFIVGSRAEEVVEQGVDAAAAFLDRRWQEFRCEHGADLGHGLRHARAQCGVDSHCHSALRNRIEGRTLGHGATGHFLQPQGQHSTLQGVVSLPHLGRAPGSVFDRIGRPIGSELDRVGFTDQGAPFAGPWQGALDAYVGAGFEPRRAQCGAHRPAVQPVQVLRERLLQVDQPALAGQQLQPCKAAFGTGSSAIRRVRPWKPPQPDAAAVEHGKVSAQSHSL
jgi:hypothetical protein